MLFYIVYVYHYAWSTQKRRLKCYLVCYTRNVKLNILIILLNAIGRLLKFIIELSDTLYHGYFLVVTVTMFCKLFTLDICIVEY